MWMSDAPKLLHSLSVRCDGRHTHTWALAGRYPPAMIATIVRGIQAQRDGETRARLEPPPVRDVMLTAVTAEEQAWSEKVVMDGYCGEPLHSELVRRGKV